MSVRAISPNTRCVAFHNGRLGPGPVLWTAHSTRFERVFRAPRERKSERMKGFCCRGAIVKSLIAGAHVQAVRTKTLFTRGFDGTRASIDLPTFISFLRSPLAPWKWRTFARWRLSHRGCALRASYQGRLRHLIRMAPSRQFHAGVWSEEALEKQNRQWGGSQDPGQRDFFRVVVSRVAAGHRFKKV